MYSVKNDCTRFGVLFTIIFLSGNVLFAQELTNTTEEDLQTTQLPPEVVSCFDYYTFGSVQAQLTASVASAVSGAKITFSGSLINKNPYPIVDGSLYVKIFKTRGENDGNGPDVVDQFFVKSELNIPAQGSIPVSFSWTVPSYAVSGEYEVATFFMTSKKFNLLGLSFTDDVVGNRVSFDVVGEQVGALGFDKSSITIAGEPYVFAAFPPRLGNTEPVEIRANVVNSTAAEQGAIIKWTVYQWDALLRENVVEEKEERLRISAGGTETIEITVNDASYPVYLVVGELRWGDTKSIIGVRFAREGIDRPRINFPSITKFPLVAGEPNTLFSCLHNAGESPAISNTRLDLAISDREGNIIHQFSYKDIVTSSMMGIASEFVPSEDYDYFTVSARLYRENDFVDEAVLTFDCQTIDPRLCVPHESEAPSFFYTVKSLLMFAGGFFLLILLLVAYRRLSSNTPQNPTSVQL